MTDRSLRLFTTIIVALTVGILLGALALRMPPEWSTIAFTTLRQPEGLRLMALGAIGLIGIIELVALLPSSSLATHVVLHSMLFPGMPMAIGVGSTEE